MNLNGDEKRIQQLFREMSLDDQRQAPQFAGVLAAAASGMSGSRNQFPSLRFAIAVAMLCIALLTAMAIIVKPSKPQGGIAPDEQAVAPAVQPEVPPSVVPLQSSVEGGDLKPHRILRHARHRRPSNQTAIAMKSLFAWQSPTASLLQTPSDELLRSLPRLGESFQTIKFFSPEDFN